METQQCFGTKRRCVDSRPTESEAFNNSRTKSHKAPQRAKRLVNPFGTDW
jgi:hypothetical protein